MPETANKRPREVTLMDRIQEQGFWVIPGAVEEDLCDSVHDQLWEYLGKIAPLMERNDPTTWNKFNRPANTRNLQQNEGFGMQRFNVDIRMATKYIFKNIWKTDKLWTSWDGVSFSACSQYKMYTFKNLADWEARKWAKEKIHVDQTFNGPVSIQGGVAILDQKMEGHCYLCVPGSHLYADELRALAGGAVDPFWCIMNEAQKAFLQSKGLDLVRVPLQKGDMVLWDSRLVHASSSYFGDCAKDARRFQVFVSMAPVPEDKLKVRKEILKRQKKFPRNHVSKHSADELRWFPQKPRLFGKEQFRVTEHPPPCELYGSEEKWVHGLLPYPDDYDHIFE